MSEPLRHVTVLFLCLYLSSHCGEAAPDKKPVHLTQKLIDELGSYQDVVEQIVNFCLNGPGQNQSYDRLAAFTDAFGNRLSGMFDIPQILYLSEV